ncbi:hypothetical protein F5879DRAFT_973209 [Lentinula edodes]|nr:hypothetical protein F5879DRAFT_973209 [Lentinula edodes]
MMFSALWGYCVYISFISSHYSPLPFADAALRIPSCNALVIQGRSGSRRYPGVLWASHRESKDIILLSTIDMNSKVGAGRNEGRNKGTKTIRNEQIVQTKAMKSSTKTYLAKQD